MDEPKHYPGPYTCETVQSNYPLDICLGYDVPGEGSPIVIAFVHCDEDDEDDVRKAKATARLFALAPTMYDLLRSLRACPQTYLTTEQQDRIDAIVYRAAHADRRG